MKTREIFMYSLGALVTIGFFSLVYIVLNIKIPSPNKEIALVLIGCIVGNFNSIINYFYGSSKGSADKTDLLNSK